MRLAQQNRQDVGVQPVCQHMMALLQQTQAAVHPRFGQPLVLGQPHALSSLAPGRNRSQRRSYLDEAQVGGWFFEPVGRHHAGAVEHR